MQEMEEARLDDNADRNHRKKSFIFKSLLLLLLSLLREWMMAIPT